MARLRRLFGIAFGRFETLLEAERQQLPLWIPVGLLAGIAAWFWLPEPMGWTAFIAWCGGLLLFALALGRGSRTAAAVASLLCLRALAAL